MPGPPLRSEFVRFHEPTKRGGEAIADLLAATRGLELVDVQIHGDRGASVPHLPLHTNRVEPALGEVRAMCVAQVMEGELGDAGRKNSVEEAEQSVPPPVSSRHGLPTPAHARPSDEGDEDATADERTSPFPYAEKFDEWVADETATSDGQHRRDAGSRNAAP